MRHAGRMRWYSDFPGQRSRQIVADIVAGVFTLGSILVGVLVGALIAGLGEIGRAVADAGGGFRDSMSELGTTLGGIPLIGETVASPFAGAGDAGASVVAAGESFQQVVAVIAVLAGIGIALLPITVIALVWLIPRIRRMRRALWLRSIVLPDGSVDVARFFGMEYEKAGVRL